MEIEDFPADQEMPQSRLRGLYDIHVIGVSAASLILNSSLILLVITERNRILHDYSKVILILCTCDMAFTLGDHFFQHIIEISDGQLVFIVRGIFANSSFRWRLLGCGLWLFALVNSAMMMPLVFIFRYYLIVRECMMSTKKIALFVFISLLNATHQAVMWTWSIYRQEQSALNKDHLIKAKFWTRSEVDNCLRTPFDSGLVMYILVVATFHDIIIYSIVIYCSVAIFRAMNSRDLYKMSSKAAETQRQMNRMLVMQLSSRRRRLQMFLPVICVMLPLTMLLVMGFLRIDASGAGLFMTAGFSWLPFLSPLITIILVSNFRRRFLRRVLAPLPCVHRIPCLRRLTVYSSATSKVAPSTSYIPTAIRQLSNRSQVNENASKT